MQIKEPKFKEGQKVRDIEYGDIYTVVEINRYSFSENEYWYDLEGDKKKYIYTRPESKLDPYQENPKTVWDLKKDDTYYLIDINGEVIEANWLGYWLDYDNDKRSRKIGNAFLTKEEAEFECERRKIETEMLRLGGRRSFKFNGKNYGMYYSNDLYVKSYEIAYPGLIYFDSKKEVDNAIETIRKDRILKYIFRFGLEE